MRGSRSSLALQGTFVTALAALACANAWSPAWAETLRGEGYYADLLVEFLDEGGQVVAGESSALRTRVVNNGPGEAGAPVLHGVAPDDVVLLGNDDNCTGAAGRLSCPMPPLAPTAERTLHIVLAPHPASRGVVAIGAHVQSPEPDPDDADNIAVTWTEVVAVRDLGVEFASVAPDRLPGGRLRWVVRMHNDGPSSVLDAEPYVYVYQAAVQDWQATCTGHGGATCAGDGVAVTLPPGGWLELAIETAPLSSPDDFISIQASLFSADGQDRGTRPNSADLWFSEYIFSDRFGDW